MSTRRGAVLIGAAAVSALLIGASLWWQDGRAAGPTTSQRQAFAFDVAYADPDPLVLVVRYGDSSSCPSTQVRHTVVQESSRVVVTLTRAPMATDQACTSDYGAKLVRVPLTTPLGLRAVVDGSRHSLVPLSTGIPPFG